ncbi:hypothetical protein [Aureispira anguillae]|uniref:Uncharacterized protein n=1 Tax=Aureispira anguillae TaxID=2864201 RepID=A0A916DWL8_9BACT|nr:hypothetical protein [Aureispira anguillae]BDS15606.1 hypothetical protein AsAng_0063900 [Aureispira anguillae]
MTREEKRYFKLYIRGLGKIEGHQSILFDYLSKQGDFDEVSIKKKLKTIFPSQNKSALQINTYQNIIKSLNLFHANTYAETKILDLLKTIKLLYVKNLFSLTIPEIEKAKKLAIEHKYVALLPQILFWEFRVKGQAFSFHHTSMDAIQEKFQEFEQALLELQNVYTYTKSWTQFYIYVRHYFSTKGGENETNPDCIQNLPQPLHLHATILDSKTKTLQAYISNDYKSGIDYMTTALHEMEQSPQVIKEYFHDYVGCLYRIIGNSIATKQWDKSQLYLKKLKETPKVLWTPTIRAIYSELLFHYNFRFGDLKANQEAQNIAIDLLTNHKQQLSLSIIRDLMLAIAVSFFYQKNYDKCIDYLTRLETIKYDDINMKNTIKIMLMLTHYEKKEYILLPYIIRSNYRFFKKNEPRRDFGYTITKSLSKVSKIISKEKVTQIFIALRTELAQNHKSYYNGNLMFFDIRAWLNSKINNISIEASLIEHRNKDILD